jgi:psiF repeat
MKVATLSCVFLFLAAGAAYAQSTPEVPRSPSCTADATTKKLAGAAKTSFMKKCESDATAACDDAAAAKKLSGAAKTSFTKKCVGDSVGSD